jgi:hypothetical protein
MPKNLIKLMSDPIEITFLKKCQLNIYKEATTHRN